MKRLPQLTMEQALPDPIGGFSVNYCRNPDCINFGVLPKFEIPHHRSKAAAEARKKSNSKSAAVGSYSLFGRPGGNRTSKGLKNEFRWSDVRALQCGICSTRSSVLSNKAYLTECERVASHAARIMPGPECPGCGTRYVDHPKQFSFDGMNGKGIRLIHNCEWPRRGGRKKRFTYTPIYRRQRNTFDNVTILQHLINGSSFNDIIRAVSAGRARKLSVGRLYDRIFWLEALLLHYERAQLSEWRRKVDREDVGRRRNHVLAHDTVELTINWETSEDRRNTILKCHATADARSGYIYRIDASFDPDVDPVKFFNANVRPGLVSRLSGKYVRKTGRQFRYPLTSFQRPTARFDEPLFYASALHQLGIFKDRTVKKIHDDDERVRLTEFANRSYDRIFKIYRDYYDMKQIERDARAPFMGAIVSMEYSHPAHLCAVRDMLPPGHITLNTDANTNLVRHVAQVFKDQIERNEFAWICSTLLVLNMPKPERAAYVETYRRNFKEWCAERGYIGPLLHLRPDYIKERKTRIPPVNEAFKGAAFKSSAWYGSPVSTYYEPIKAVGIMIGSSFLRNQIANGAIDRNGHDEIAHYMNRSSLQTVDTFFNSLRERIAATGRASGSGGSMGGTYIRGNVFNPRVLIALLNIFRISHNYFELRPMETDTIEQADDPEAAPEYIRSARIPGTDDTVEIRAKRRRVPRKLSPAMRHGIHKEDSSKVRAVDLPTVLSRPWEVYGTPLFGRLIR